MHFRLDHISNQSTFVKSSAMSWNDTSCSFKAVLLTGPIVRFLAAEDLLTSTLANHILIAVLQGLQIHGQHEANQVLNFTFFFIALVREVLFTQDQYLQCNLGQNFALNSAKCSRSRIIVTTDL